jgi:hypothetical protein
MRFLTILTCLVFCISGVLAAKVELVRGSRTVKGRSIVSIGFEEKHILTVSAENPDRQHQFDMHDVKRISIIEKNKTLVRKETFLRKRADARSEAVSVLYPGTELVFEEENQNWVKVMAYDRNSKKMVSVGYVAKDTTSNAVSFTQPDKKDTKPNKKK